LSQLFLVSSIGLLVATIFTACQLVTIDYVFVADSGGSQTCPGGQIETYAVDSQSGALRTGAPEVCSGGTNPVALAVSPSGLNLYVANQTDSTLIHFSVSLNGVLTKKDTVTLSSQGSAPTSLAVNAAGTFLYVVSADYPGTSGSVAGGTLAVFPIGSDGTIGTAVANGSLNYWPLTLPGNSSDVLVPTGVTVLANNDAVYVTAYDQSAYNPGGLTTSTQNPGWVFGFTAGTSGALAATSGSPYKAGVKPTALVADPTSRFVYVTDFASNELIGYGIGGGDTLDYLVNGPFKTGNEPSSVAIDPRGKYLYVSNALDSSVSAYAIDLPTGTPTVTLSTTSATGGANTTDTQPVSIAVDPALGRFVYTANYLGNSISGFRLDPNSGALTTTQATPYPTGPKPTSLVIVPHGNHSLQSVTP
jgi:6-phosphogluconolactonase (cycloisomerase 2 family)